jgi:hypothetical protein
MSWLEDVESLLLPLDYWCSKNEMKFTRRAVSTNVNTGRIEIIYAFENPGDAVLFALRWQDNDWGLMWHPV